MQRILREQGPKFVQAVWQPGAPQPVHRPAEEDELPEQEEADERAEAAPPLRAPVDGTRAHGSEPAPAVAPAPVAGLTRADAQKLQAALHDLTECRRLLDAALAQQA